MKKIILMLMLLTQSAFPDISHQLSNCARISDDNDRLKCFDAISATFKPEHEKPKESLKINTGTGIWQINESINPVDDSKTIVLGITSNKVTGTYGDPIKLIVRCLSNKTELYIDWESYLGLDGTKVTTRIDKHPASTKTWSISTDNKASFHTGKTISFIKSMFNAKMLLAQVTPYSESPKIVTFKITGIENAIKPLRETCGW